MSNSTHMKKHLQWRRRRLRFECFEDRRLLALDFGDAPAPYPVTLAENGARHEAIGPMIGATRDSESDGNPSANADGDGADEDGFTFGILIIGQTDAQFYVTINDAPAGAIVDAWIDFNQDGSWNQVGERILRQEFVNEGMNSFSFSVPSWSQVGTTFARVRLSSTGVELPTGIASDGEVEDIVLEILPPQESIDTFGPPETGFEIRFVEIYEPNNAVDSLTALGRTSYNFRISKYAISRDVFLAGNNVGNLGFEDTLYDYNQQGISNRPGMPATSISWYEAAVFVNWLNKSNGFHDAYKLSGDLLWEQDEAWQIDGQNLFRH